MTLTREKVLAMVAGREMDEAIGKAFDLKPSIQTRQESILIIKDRIFKRYSTDISAAWEVADKLKIAIIPQSISAPDKLKYLARIEWDFKQLEIDVLAETAPLAICRAALLSTIA